MSIDRLPRLNEVELFAWIGEDELGSGVIGIKQGFCPAGYIPLVAVDRSKMEREQFVGPMNLQAGAYGKRIYLCRYRLEEVLYQTPKGEPPL
jgi:hypothetical protein